MEFLNEDCMDLMKRYPDKHFDLAIVDPPYGLDMHLFGFKKDYLNKMAKDINKWDKKPDKKYFIELIRVSKIQIVCGINNYSQYFGCFTPIIWDKKNGDSMMADGELIGITIKSKLRIFRHAYIGKYNIDPIRIHPTQKPVALYKWLLKNYAKEGDLILDTHVGSASSLIACEEMGFDYVGCELDKDYYEMACKRIEKYREQLRLF